MLANIVETYSKPIPSKTKSHASIFRRSKDEKEKKTPTPHSLKDGSKTSRSSTSILSSSIHADIIRKSTSDAQLTTDHADAGEKGKGKEEDDPTLRLRALKIEIRDLEEEANALLKELGRGPISEKDREERRERAKNATLTRRQ